MPTTKYPANEFVLLSVGGELSCYKEAPEDSNDEDWVVAMKNEMEYKKGVEEQMGLNNQAR